MLYRHRKGRTLLRTPPTSRTPLEEEEDQPLIPATEGRTQIASYALSKGGESAPRNNEYFDTLEETQLRAPGDTEGVGPNVAHTIATSQRPASGANGMQTICKCQTRQYRPRLKESQLRAHGDTEGVGPNAPHTIAASQRPASGANGTMQTRH